MQFGSQPAPTKEQQIFMRQIVMTSFTIAATSSAILALPNNYYNFELSVEIHESDCILSCKQTPANLTNAMQRVHNEFENFSLSKRLNVDGNTEPILKYLRNQEMTMTEFISHYEPTIVIENESKVKANFKSSFELLNLCWRRQFYRYKETALVALLITNIKKSMERLFAKLVTLKLSKDQASTVLQIVASRIFNSLRFDDKKGFTADWLTKSATYTSVGSFVDMNNLIKKTQVVLSECLNQIDEDIQVPQLFYREVKQFFAPNTDNMENAFRELQSRCLGCIDIYLTAIGNLACSHKNSLNLSFSRNSSILMQIYKDVISSSHKIIKEFIRDINNKVAKQENVFGIVRESIALFEGDFFAVLNKNYAIYKANVHDDTLNVFDAICTEVIAEKIEEFRKELMDHFHFNGREFPIMKSSTEDASTSVTGLEGKHQSSRSTTKKKKKARKNKPLNELNQRQNRMKPYRNPTLDDIILGLSHMCLKCWAKTFFPEEIEILREISSQKLNKNK
ncbi:hypothetical protein ROZALSC1DRAFT_27108 [Rozella allomycis CSF55]|uniref:Uncharacterized protein n=1 Tax=Rozella allomycis (strain CSF55) TaxID=988480 RepID=A0A4P9YQD6_ROZAC|nr:hypothetical protein ROZALSC1DRAFT_27108 [Rozella allomycis CSF55]